MNKNRVTIKDVAKEAGVSIATVSYVLNNTPGQSISDSTRKKVLQFANLLGYECNVMARYLATGKTNTVAVVIKNTEPFASQYYLKLLAEMSRMLRRNDFDLKLFDYADALNRNADCDAYITLALSEKEFRAFADTKYVPVVAVDSIFDDPLFFRINDDFDSLNKSAASEFGTPATLLTFGLPEEVIGDARRAFKDVKVISALSDLNDLDDGVPYVTVSGPIYDSVSASDRRIKLENASFALKASAVVQAVRLAINSTHGEVGNHDMRV